MKRALTLVLAAMLIFTMAGAASAQYKATMKLARTRCGWVGGEGGLS